MMEPGSDCRRGEPDDAYGVDLRIDRHHRYHNWDRKCKSGKLLPELPAFNAQEAQLKADGVRIFGPNASVAQT